MKCAHFDATAAHARATWFRKAVVVSARAVHTHSWSEPDLRRECVLVCVRTRKRFVQQQRNVPNRDKATTTTPM